MYSYNYVVMTDHPHHASTLAYTHVSTYVRMYVCMYVRMYIAIHVRTYCNSVIADSIVTHMQNANVYVHVPYTSKKTAPNYVQ